MAQKPSDDAPDVPEERMQRFAYSEDDDVYFMPPREADIEYYLREKERQRGQEAVEAEEA